MAGDGLTVSQTDLGCDGQVVWSRVNKTTGEETITSVQNQAISGNYSLSITTSDHDHFIKAVGRCNDPSSPSGYGQPRTLGLTKAVITAIFVYTIQHDDRGSGYNTITSVENSSIDPIYSEPYSVDLGYPTNPESNLGYATAYYDITVYGCPGTAPSTAPTIRRGPEGSIPSTGTIISKTNPDNIFC